MDESGGYIADVSMISASPILDSGVSAETQSKITSLEDISRKLLADKGRRLIHLPQLRATLKDIRETWLSLFLVNTSMRYDGTCMDAYAARSVMTRYDIVGDDAARLSDGDYLAKTDTAEYGDTPDTRYGRVAWHDESNRPTLSPNDSATIPSFLMAASDDSRHIQGTGDDSIAPPESPHIPSCDTEPYMHLRLGVS